ENDCVQGISLRAISGPLLHTLAYILASLINIPVALRLQAWGRQGATYHVELKAIVLLHQTQHKHAETCNGTTNNVSN
ncbi:hypothetical protein DVA81_19795, partial [Acinetobacter baumannii]